MNKSKNATPYFLIGAALACSVVFSGGLNWQHCIIPLTLLTFAAKPQGSVFNILFPAMLALMGVSAVSTIGDMQTAIYESEKLMCFIAAFTACRFLKNDTNILKIIFYTAVATAFFGVLAYCSIIDISEFTFNDNNALRLQSFIRYANVTACFSGCGYAAFLELYARERKRIYQYLGALILIAMYLTVSKAFIVLFTLAGTGLIYLKKEYRTVFVLQNSAAIIAFALILITKPHLVDFILIAACVAIGGACGRDYDKSFKVWLGILGAAALAAAEVMLIRPSLIYTLLLRMDYSQDALALLGNNLLFGNGVGSWRMAQYKVQSGEYSVTYMHNGILQLAVENGLIFTLIFIAIAFIAVIKSARNRQYHFMAIISFILIHSLFDFNLSMAAMLITLGMCLGAVFADTPPIPRLRITGIVLAICLLVTDIYMISEFFVRSAFEKAYIAQDYETAKKRLDTLEVLCPRDPQIQVSYAAMEEDTDEIRRRLKRAVELSSLSPKLYESFMNYEINYGNIADMCMHYLDLAPKQEYTYVFIKDYAARAHELNRISTDELNALLEAAENRRIEEGVIDRNALLHEIVTERNSKDESSIN